mmetsp:Transcript_32416/g.95529  ORF Transcript_32416/g.95529 Transcript_32416/m.95529 type:complete len:249 (-) Transcript_32416:204-950(-)
MGIEVLPETCAPIVDALDIAVHDVGDGLEVAVLVGQRPSDEGALSLEMHGVELHGAASQVFDGLEELVEALRMLGARTPKTETVHEAHVLGLGDGRGRAVDDASLGKAALQLHNGGGRFGALGLVLGIEHGLAVLVELDVLGLIACVENDMRQTKQMTETFVRECTNTSCCNDRGRHCTQARIQPNRTQNDDVHAALSPSPLPYLVTLVEHNEPIERIAAAPVDDLLEAALVLSASLALGDEDVVRGA